MLMLKVQVELISQKYISQEKMENYDLHLMLQDNL